LFLPRRSLSMINLLISLRSTCLVRLSRLILGGGVAIGETLVSVGGEEVVNSLGFDNVGASFSDKKELVFSDNLPLDVRGKD